jgi:hypothetical protein
MMINYPPKLQNNSIQAKTSLLLLRKKELKAAETETIIEFQQFSTTIPNNTFAVLQPLAGGL